MGKRIKGEESEREAWCKHIPVGVKCRKEAVKGMTQMSGNTALKQIPGPTEYVLGCTVLPAVSIFVPLFCEF